MGEHESVWKPRTYGETMYAGGGRLGPPLSSIRLQELLITKIVTVHI